jgi:hypothetical protein
VGEVCDLAYVLLLEALERQVLADRQVAAVFIAARAEGVDLPSFAEQRARFDAALVAEPVAVQVETEQQELRRMLGVA